MGLRMELSCLIREGKAWYRFSCQPKVENAMTNESDNEEGGATPSVSSKAATAKTGRSGRCSG